MRVLDNNLHNESAGRLARQCSRAHRISWASGGCARAAHLPTVVAIIIIMAQAQEAPLSV